MYVWRQATLVAAQGMIVLQADSSDAEDANECEEDAPGIAGAHAISSDSDEDAGGRSSPLPATFSDASLGHASDGDSVPAAAAEDSDAGEDSDADDASWRDGGVAAGKRFTRAAADAGEASNWLVELPDDEHDMILATFDAELAAVKGETSWGAGGIGDFGDSRITVDQFIDMVEQQENPGPEEDREVSFVLCSKPEFQEAICVALEEAVDCIGEVKELTTKFFPEDDMDAFLLFSPGHHVHLKKKHSLSKRSEKKVLADLEELVDKLANRYTKATCEIRGESHEIPKRMSRSLMKAQLPALHRLMTRSSASKSGFEMAAGICKGCVSLILSVLAADAHLPSESMLCASSHASLHACRRYPGVEAFKLAAAIHNCLPLSSADVERLFSQMNYIHDELRNRLKEENLDTAMRAFSASHNYQKRDYSEMAKSVVVCSCRSPVNAIPAFLWHAIMMCCFACLPMCNCISSKMCTEQ